MLLRNCFTASLLFCVFATAAIAQGTPGGKTTIITEFTPLSQEELQKGTIRLFDGFSTYGWKGDVKVENRILYFKDFEEKFEDTPYWFFKPGAEKLVQYPAIPQAEVRQMERGKLPPLRGFELRVEGQKPLFDGKTLDGWKLHGKAEAVVENGTIKLTNGSGSLESEGKYGDFILQLEYKTDKVVNSGVFFRSIPGEIMNGYECQILNNSPDGDYEKFIGTDTGGIFRRQVGRNVGPKDGEWNYLTIAAKGNRMATWVNGIQVTDWTDERTPHNNPRNGSRTEAGTIQFQGHDPGTEIWFRNIRIREL